MDELCKLNASKNVSEDQKNDVLKLKFGNYDYQIITIITTNFEWVK